MQTFKVTRKIDWQLILPEVISDEPNSFTTKAASKIAAFLEAQLVHYTIIDDTITILDDSIQFCDSVLVHYSDYEVVLIDIDNETIKNY
jgi:hypothetical protein